MAHFTNAQLAQNISNLIADDVAIKTEFQAWLAGAIGGGPNSDGQFPLTDYLGTTRLTTCPAQMEDDVDNNVTGSLAHKDAAETAQTAAELAETNAETAQALAETAQTASVVAKDTAVTAKDDAETARATAIAQAAVATAKAILTAADVVLTNADVVSTNADVVSTNADVVLTGLDVTYAAEWATAVEDLLISAAAGGNQVDDFSALHWAAKAATFNPALYALLTGATFAGAVTASNLNVSNWDTAFGWGNHASGGYAASGHLHDNISDTNLVDKSAAETIDGLWNHAQTFYTAVLQDKISLFDDRLGGTTMYGFGAESGYLYSKAPTGHRWYIGANADVGGSDYLELNATEMRHQVPIKIRERAAAVGNTSTYGQLWVKNTTPNELWFTDDVGTDTKIA